jgi:hypothetical protein
MGADEIPALPDESSVLQGLLTALGAPFVVVLLVAIFLWALSWIQTSLGLYRGGRAAGQALSNLVKTRTTESGRYRFLFIVAGAAFSALFIAAARLTPHYWGKSGSPTWDDWAWIPVILTWDQDSFWYLAGIAVSIGLLGIAELIHSMVLHIAVLVVWVPLLILSALAGVFWTIGALGNLLMLGLQALSGVPNDDYTWASLMNFVVLGGTALGAAVLALFFYTLRLTVAESS